MDRGGIPQTRQAICPGFRWRQFFQYRLLTLLVLTALIAAWLAWWSHSARRQREAVDAIYRAGAFVHYDFNERQLNRPPHWPQWLVKAVGVHYFANVTGIFFERGATDASIRSVEQLTTVQWVNLEGTQATDAGLQHLKGLSALRLLNLNDSQITDAGLEHLKGLSALQELQLYQTKVTDAGVARLKQSLPNCNIQH